MQLRCKEKVTIPQRWWMLRQQIINRLIQFQAIQSVPNWISNCNVRLRERERKKNCTTKTRGGKELIIPWNLVTVSFTVTVSLSLLTTDSSRWFWPSLPQPVEPVTALTTSNFLYGFSRLRFAPPLLSPNSGLSSTKFECFEPQIGGFT